jgi:hypothetical protein
MARSKLLLGLFTTIAALLIAGFAGRMLLQYFVNEMMEHKVTRDTTAVTVGKKYVQFEAGQPSYVNDQGQTIALDGASRKSGEFRIYYKINNFDQVPGSKQRGLTRGDEEREKKFGPRFTIVDERTYDQAQVGQSINVTYRWASDSDIEVIVVDFPKDPARDKPSATQN